jgi:hypothetical protein
MNAKLNRRKRMEGIKNVEEKDNPNGLFPSPPPFPDNSQLAPRKGSSQQAGRQRGRIFYWGQIGHQGIGPFHPNQFASPPTWRGEGRLGPKQHFKQILHKNGERRRSKKINMLFTKHNRNKGILKNYLY